MSLERIIKLLTFIPWILYFVEIVYYRISVIENTGLDKDKYFEYLKHHKSTTINVKEIILYLIFLIFMRYKKTYVLEILFVATYIYLLIDFFFTLAKDCKKIKLIKIMALNVLLITGIIVFFLITNHLYITYNLMFAVSILNAFLVFLYSLTCKKEKLQEMSSERDSIQ